MAPALLHPRAENSGLDHHTSLSDGNARALKASNPAVDLAAAGRIGSNDTSFTSAPLPSTDATTPCPRPPAPLDHYLSQEGRARQQGTLRSLAGQFAGVPGLISLSGGFPPPHLFPFASISLKLHDGTEINITDPGEMATAQQYNFALRGNAQLVGWLTEHMQALHGPPVAAAHQVLVTNGGNHTLEMIMSLFLDREDTFLVEEYTYPVVTESIAQPKGLIPIPVPIDNNGIIPSRLAAVLHSAAAAAAQPGGPPMPKLLYTVPTGQNPTGCSITAERRVEIYALCRQYDVWIVEDDAYFYLQYTLTPTAPRHNMHTTNATLNSMATDLPLSSTCSLGSDEGLDLSGSDFPLVAVPEYEYQIPGLHGLGSSYLSGDVDGRVIRVDTFAKFLAPGLRLGWVTARGDVVGKLTSMIHSHTVGPCSLSQSVTAATLTAWGPSGLHHHLQKAQQEYAHRASIAVTAATRHLTGLAEWNIPRGGMFLWIKLLGGLEDASEVWDELKQAKVVVLPGRVMHCRAGDVGFKSPFIRVSFSNAGEEELREGIRRVGQVIREYASRKMLVE